MEQTEEEARKFNWKNWGAVRKMGHYLRPHAWGYALGVLIISLSGVLTLLVTRLWGQLGVGSGDVLTNFGLNELQIGASTTAVQRRWSVISSWLIASALVHGN